VRSRFGDVAGTVHIGHSLADTTAQVRIATAGIDTGVAMRDTHLRSPEFFDVVRHPVMTFRGFDVHRHADHYTSFTTAVGSSLDDLPLVMPSTQLREVVVGTGVALRIVNRETGATRARMALTPAGVVRVGGVGAIAADVACATVELLGDIGNLRIKECGDPECTRIFIDRSRGGNRHWCGMEECCNRVKAAAYRSRKAKV
jgi:hypothetical protein